MSNPNFHLREEKACNILVTNVCNLSCGGCHQFCGQFSKEDLWFIPLDQLRSNIITLGENANMLEIGLFGGEPTLHPEYEAILDMCHSMPYQFLMYTNGRLLDGKIPKGSEPIDCELPKDGKINKGINFSYQRKNICYRVSYKTATIGRCFCPTGIAAKDVLGVEDNNHYWKLAQKHCHMWQNCSSVIYNNKAYFCETAGAMEHLLGTSHGWPVTPGKNPLNQTNKKIAKQASNFCYRCGWCLPPGDRQKMPKQKTLLPTLVTETNTDLNLKKDVSLVVLQNGRPTELVPLNMYVKPKPPAAML